MVVKLALSRIIRNSINLVMTSTVLWLALVVGVPGGPVPERVLVVRTREPSQSQQQNQMEGLRAIIQMERRKPKHVTLQHHVRFLSIVLENGACGVQVRGERVLVPKLVAVGPRAKRIQSRL